ncbi:Crp/Fnr family transcriptional regulator [Candidatus Bipolaricaulota bacterium]
MILQSHRPLRIRYVPGEMICQAGSYVAGIHLIVRGVASDMMLTMKGEQRNSDILGAGDLIGLEIMQSNSDELSISLCRALTTVELLFVEKSQFESALNDDPALQEALLRYAVSRYVFTRKDPRQRASVEAQLCRLLLRLGEVCGLPAADSNVALPVEITLRTLGQLLCISSRQLRHARQAVHSFATNDSGIEFDPDEARQMISNDCFTTA